MATRMHGTGLYNMRRSMNAPNVLIYLPRHLDTTPRDLLTGECYACHEPIGAHRRDCRAASRLIAPRAWNKLSAETGADDIRIVPKSFVERMAKISTGEHAGWDDFLFLEAMAIDPQG